MSLRSNKKVHEYESVAQKVMQKMIGQDVFSLSFSRKDKAITLGNKTAIQISPDRTTDCALLFQCFIVVSKTEELSLEDIMVYEISPFPPALFETNNLFRKANKPQLAHVISECANGGILDIMPETECYVLDGGSLLHRVSWKRGETYGTIAKSYADFTIKHYATPTVIFDGYECRPSIKDNVHPRRGYNIHPIVSFTSDTEFNGKKEEFLSKAINKQQLINLITDEMKKEIPPLLMLLVTQM